MKINKWTLGLAAVGLVSLSSVAQAEEKLVPITTALSQTVISGYVDVGANWTLGSGNANPVPVSFNGVNKQDGFNVNVVNLTLERPLDEGTWSAGYKAELLFGPDAVFYNTSANAGFLGDNDFAIKQAYVALRAPVGNGLDLKVGSFDTIIGYESFVGYRNPNITRSYGYTIEPTEHTGILATYQVCDALSLSAGVANTLAPFVNNRNLNPGSESRKTYMGSITLTAPESFGILAGSSLYGGIVEGFNGDPEDNQSSYYVGTTIATPVTGLKLGLAYDQVSSGGSGLGGYAAALAAYASFQATEKLSLHTRAEYAKGAVGNNFGTPGGESGKIFALTETVQYDLWQNVISRLEARWDHSASGSDEFGGRGFGTAGAAPTKKNSIGIYASLIYVF